MPTRVIKEMIGRTFSSVENKGGEELVFTESGTGRSFVFFHIQDCCEHVRIEDICGELSDLAGSPILLAEETSESRDTEYGSETWTFYRFATFGGSVTVRWLGESNGYYSESVSFEWRG